MVTSPAQVPRFLLRPQSSDGTSSQRHRRDTNQTWTIYECEVRFEICKILDYFQAKYFPPNSRVLKFRVFITLSVIVAMTITSLAILVFPSLATTVLSITFQNVSRPGARIYQTHQGMGWLWYVDLKYQDLGRLLKIVFNIKSYLVSALIMGISFVRLSSI